MKHTVQKLAMAAALVACGLSQAAVITATPNSWFTVTDPNGSGRAAQLVFDGGQGSLEFSNGTGVLGGVPTTSVGGLVGALNVGKVVLTSVDNATITETKVPIGRTPPRGVVSIGATVSSLSVNDQTGQVLSVGSFGGAQQDADYLDGVLDGGRMTVKNLRFDLANKTVYADLYGQALDINNNLGPVQTSLNTALWTITSISGPTTMPPAALLAAASGDFSKMEELGYGLLQDNTTGQYKFSATNVLSGLKVTTQGFDFFAKSLGLTAGSTGYTTLAGVNNQTDGWGSIKSTLSFSAPIPEPATYALMAIGLVGIVMVAKRRPV